MAIPVRRGAPDLSVNASASPDRRGPVRRPGQGPGRPPFDPADPRAAMIDQQLADREHLRPGSTLRLLGVPGITSNPDLAHAVPLAFRVSAVVAASTTRSCPATTPRPQPTGRAQPGLLAGRRDAAVQVRRGRCRPAAARGQHGGVRPAPPSALATRYPATGGKLDHHLGRGRPPRPSGPSARRRSRWRSSRRWAGSIALAIIGPAAQPPAHPRLDGVPDPARPRHDPGQAGVAVPGPGGAVTAAGGLPRAWRSPSRRPR